MGTRDLPDICAPEGKCIYIRQISSAHVITNNYIALLGAIIFIVADKSVIVVFNYHVLFMFVMNESMKLCVSESLLCKQESV